MNSAVYVNKAIRDIFGVQVQVTPSQLKDFIMTSGSQMGWVSQKLTRPSVRSVLVLARPPTRD